MVDCAQNRADRPLGDFAIPRLRALPYKINGTINADCVRAGMARWNQVKGATDEERTSAKNKLINAAKKVGIDVKKFSETFYGEKFEYSIDNLLSLFALATIKNDKETKEHARLLLSIIHGFEKK